MNMKGFSYRVYRGDTLEIRAGLSSGGERTRFDGVELVLSIDGAEYGSELSADGKTALFRLSGDTTAALGEGAHLATLVLKNDAFRRTFAGEVTVVAVGAAGVTPESAQAGGTLVLSADSKLTKLACETLVKIDQFPDECRQRLDEVESTALGAKDAAFAAALSAADSEAVASDGAHAAATAAAAAIAAAANAQNTSLMRYEAAICPLLYSDDRGYYAELSAAGDSLGVLYNVWDCRTVALHLCSADGATTGMAVVAANGVECGLPVTGVGTWAEMELGTSVNGALKITLVAGVTDSEGSSVAIVVDGVRVTCGYLPLATGYQSRQVAATPLFYSDAVGCHHLLSPAHPELKLLQPVSGLTAVALLAHGETAGETSVVLTVGENQFAATLTVSETPLRQLLAPGFAGDGLVTITYTGGADAVISNLVLYCTDGEGVVDAAASAVAGALRGAPRLQPREPAAEKALAPEEDFALEADFAPGTPDAEAEND